MMFYRYDYEIHIQDDGCTDKTKEIAERENTKVFSNIINLGLAETFKKELENAKDADIIIHTDADNQYPAKDIPFLIEQIKEGYDLVLGSRFLKKDDYSESWMKKTGNKIFSKVISKLTKQKITDSTTGFRAFNQKVAALPLINSFTYTQEQIIRAAKAGLRIKEIPVKTRETRKSKLFKSPIDYAIKAWINIFRIYRDFDPIKFFGKIGLLIMSPGILMGLYMIYNLITTGHVGYLNFTILAAVFLLAGLQVILFGFIADMNRRN